MGCCGVARSTCHALLTPNLLWKLQLGKDPFHRVPLLAAKVRDAVERVLTIPKQWSD